MTEQTGRGIGRSGPIPRPRALALRRLLSLFRRKKGRQPLRAQRKECKACRSCRHKQRPARHERRTRGRAGLARVIPFGVPLYTLKRTYKGKTTFEKQGKYARLHHARFNLSIIFSSLATGCYHPRQLRGQISSPKIFRMLSATSCSVTG